MVSITSSQAKILLDPRGSNVWSGQMTQSLNSQAITWSLATQLYGRNGPYFIIPMSLFIGATVTVIQWLIWKVRIAAQGLIHLTHKSTTAMAQDRTR